MNVVSIFDTTIMEYNLGNQIIMQAVYSHLGKIFPDAFFIKIPYFRASGTKESNLFRQK